MEHYLRYIAQNEWRSTLKLYEINPRCGSSQTGLVAHELFQQQKTFGFFTFMLLKNEAMFTLSVAQPFKV